MATPRAPIRVRMGGRSGATVHGRAALVPAIGSIALGVASAGLGIAYRAPDDRRPLGFFLVAGGMAVVVGIVFLLHALTGMRDEARRRRAVAAGAEPWLADHAWRRHGAREEGRSEVRRRLLGTAAMALFLGGFAYILTLASDEPGAIGGWAVLAVMTGFLVLGSGHQVLGAVRRARHGRLQLRYGQFPFFLGGRLDAELVRPHGGPALRTVAAVLRCVQEQYVSSRRGRIPVESAVLHEERATFGPGGDRLRIPVRFELPADPALATDLTAKPPRYWELEVSSDVPGLDLRATFVVPVYARQPEASTA
jgi:hypothetical protein